MLLIGIGVWIIALILVLLFFKGATREKEVMLLKPLDMDKSKLDVTLMKELVKCVEEDEEFVSVQTKLNVMGMMGIPTNMVYRDLDKHIKKMHERGYVFKE